ncbi:IclR family transcriptional regulator, partial [Haloparvum sedimenti]|uniref:IclR family transcriptional regulator n=1 Tax=Haloparvum sedimenti TaxID=1678448 RepID=UPI001C401171
HLDESRRDEILEDYQFVARTPNTITDEETLRAELERVRQVGYAINDEEQITGVRAVAAPIVHEDTIYGAISLSTPTSRMPEDEFVSTAPERILDVANVIEVNIQTP